MRGSAGSPRRVLIVVQNLPVPFDRRVWLEATTLARRGFKVSVICPKAKGFTKSYERLEDVDIYRYKIPFEASGTVGFVAEFVWCLLRTAGKMMRVSLGGRGFDILHVCNPPETYWLLGYPLKALGKSFLFDHHDLSPEMYEAKFPAGSRATVWALRFLERMTFRAADVVITTNESHKTVAVERGGMSPDDVFIVRSGPDTGRFKRHAPDAELRQGKTHVIAYLGEICVQDGVDHLIRAVKILREDLGRTDFHCILVGGGPHQPAIKDLASELGVGDACSFLGRVSDDYLCRALSSADLAVDPDPKNSWSDKSTMNKIMEYMYFGLPIVSYDLTETRRSADKAASYVEPNDCDALAKEIDRLLNAPDERRAMGSFGQQRLESELAWQHSVPFLLAAYDRLSEGVHANSKGDRGTRTTRVPTNARMS